MGLGLLLFWPALFFIDGDIPEAQEYARLRGRYEALEKVSIGKKCGFEFKDIQPHLKRQHAKDKTSNPL